MNLVSGMIVNDSGYVFNSMTGESFSINQTARLVLTLLGEGCSKTDIYNRLLSEYDVEASSLEADVDDFFYLLRKYRILVD
ncbi:MAG: PqqD family protein [Paludibacteraceae bacterium]|nr:PqqD family protein [Paludibacteraceae bacterium]MCR5497446.1 PqqD family protein [Paludibacteraceae bacterium]